MAVIKLRKEGKDFIHSVCNGTGNSKLSGSAKDKKGYEKNPTAVLPYCSPLTTVDDEWTSNPDINGGITTDGELAEELIRLYNKYAEIYEMDANILAAQAHQESGFIIWNYAVNSSASGISQFIAAAIYDVIILNKFGGFSIAERQAISKDMIGYTFSSSPSPPKTAYLVDFPLGRQNRPILHQNIIDNLDIMIKAQFIYMKHISKRCDNLASCTLFGYNRGPGYVQSSSYSDAIALASNVSKNYEVEGINYVYRIFLNLYEKFGYRHLNITDSAAKNFDKFYGTLG